MQEYWSTESTFKSTEYMYSTQEYIKSTYTQEYMKSTYLSTVHQEYTPRMFYYISCSSLVCNVKCHYKFKLQMLMF